MPPQNSRSSRLAGRAAVLIAALASVATQQARWNVDTKATVTTVPSGKGLWLAVEASHPPEVGFQRANRALGMLPGPATSAWPGRQEWLVPPGYGVGTILLEGRCTGGCFDKCVPPPGAFVRVSKEDLVDVWERSEDSALTTTTLAAPDTSKRYTIRVESTLVTDLEVVLPKGHAGLERPHLFAINPTYTDAGPSTQEFGLFWYSEEHKPPPSPVAVTWAVKVRQYGRCKGGAACAPEPGVIPPKVTISSP